MNPELIALLGRLVVAHEKLADGVSRMADQLKTADVPYDNPTFSSQLSFDLGQISNALDSISEALPKPPEE